MFSDDDFSLLPLPEMPVKSISPAREKTRLQKIFPVVWKILKIIGKILLWTICIAAGALPDGKNEERTLNDVMSKERIIGSDRYRSVDDYPYS